MKFLENQTENKLHAPQIEDFSSIKVSINNTHVYKEATIQINGYTDLYNRITNIIEVCRVALLNEEEKIDGFAVCQTLEVAQGLIPYDEFVLLDNLHAQSIERLKETTATPTE